jgi:hypothetical protein
LFVGHAVEVCRRLELRVLDVVSHLGFVKTEGKLETDGRGSKRQQAVAAGDPLGSLDD